MTKLILWVFFLLALISCEGLKEEAKEEQIALDVAKVELDTIYIRGENLGAYMIRGSCIEMGIPIRYELQRGEGDEAEVVHVGDLLCSDKRWEIGPINFYDLLEGEKVELILSFQGITETKRKRLIKDTTSPTLLGLDGDRTIAVKEMSWNLKCDESDCRYRYVINRQEMAGSVLDASDYSESNANPRIDSSDGIFYLHVQAVDEAGNESSVATDAALLDNTNPIMAGLTMPEMGTYPAGSALNFILIYQNPVKVRLGKNHSRPYMNIRVGPRRRQAIFKEVNNSNGVVFQYIVGAEEVDSDGIEFEGHVYFGEVPVVDDAGNRGDALVDATSFVTDLSLVKVDSRGPIVTLIVPPMAKTYRENDELIFLLNYDEPVQVIGNPELQLRIGDKIVAIEYVPEGTGQHYRRQLRFRYRIQRGDNANGGEVIFNSLSFADNNSGVSIVDGMGNVGADSFPPSIVLPNFSGIRIDALAPELRSISKVLIANEDHYYKHNDRLGIQVSFSETVNLPPQVKLLLTVGSDSEVEAIHTGGHSDQHFFNYTVGPNDNDEEGGIQVTGFKLDSGGHIVDSVGNVMMSLSGLNFNLAPVVVDTVQPTFEGAWTLPVDKEYGEGEVLEFVGTYSEPVYIHGNIPPYLQLHFANSLGTSQVVSGNANLLPDHDSNATTVKFGHTIVEGIWDNNGIELPSLIELPEGTSLTDAAGNPAILQLSLPQHLAMVTINAVDDFPELLEVSSHGTGPFGVDDEVVLTAHFNREVEITQINGIVLMIEEKAVIANLSGSGSFSQTHDFSYRITAGENSRHVMVTGIDLGSGLIKDRSQIPVRPEVLQILVNNMVIDTQPPTIVTSFKEETLGDDRYYKQDDVVKIKVSFNEPATIDSQVRLLLNVGSDPRVMADYTSGHGTEHLFHYTVNAGDNDTDGTIQVTGLDLGGNGQVVDLAGNALTQLNGYNFLLTDTVIDTISPERTGNWELPSGRVYGEGESLEFIITYHEDVILSDNGTPYLELGLANSTQSGNITSGNALLISDHDNNARTLKFVYVIPSGVLDDNGIDLPNAITLPSGVAIEDAAGNAASLSLATPATSHLSSVTINAVSDLPVIVGVSAEGDGLFLQRDTVTLSTRFNKEVVIEKINGLILSVGGQSIVAPLSGDGEFSDLHEFSYQVASGHNDRQASVIGIDFGEEGTIKDRNNHLVSDQSLLIYINNMVVDTKSPKIASVERVQTFGEDSYYKTGDMVSILVNFDESVTVGEQVNLVLEVGSARDAVASYISGSGVQHVFKYRVGADHNDSDGGIQVSSIHVAPGNQVVDVVGNVIAETANLNFQLTDVIIDTTPPVQLGNWTYPSSGPYGLGDRLEFVVRYDGPIVITGDSAPYLDLDFTNRVGHSQLTFGKADVVSDHDNDPSTLKFSYQIEAGILDDNGIDIARTIGLPGGTTLTDISGNAAPLEVGSPAHLQGIEIDSVAELPKLVSMTAQGNGFYQVDDVVVLQALFNRKVKIEHISGLLLEVGNGAVYATLRENTTFSKSYIFEYRVREGEDINQVNVLRISFGNGVIYDQLNNPILNQDVGIAIGNMVIDTITPELLWEGSQNPSTIHNQYIWNWSCRDVNDCQYRVAFNEQNGHIFQDGLTGDIFSQTTNFTTPSDISGTRYIHVQARDNAGNLSPVSTGRIVLDAVGPILTLVTPPADQNYGRGATLRFTLQFNETVYVNTSQGTPTISLTIGQNTRQLIYVDGSGGQSLNFEYVISDTDEDVTGLTLGQQIIDGRIEDIAENIAQTSLVGKVPDLQGIKISASLTRVAITNAPPYINLSNRGNYEFSGECSDYQSVVQLSYLVLGTVHNLPAVACNNGRWSSGGIDFSRNNIEGTIGLIAHHGNAQNNKATTSVQVIQDTIAPALTFDTVPNVDANNLLNYQLTGTCQGADVVRITLRTLDALTAPCTDGRWTISPMNLYYLPIGNVDLEGKITDMAGNSFQLSTSVRNFRNVRLPYYISEGRSYYKVKAKGLPHNYIGKIYLSPDSEATIASVRPEQFHEGTYTEDQLSAMGQQWMKFFDLDAATGILAVNKLNKNIRSLFNLPNNFNAEIYPLSTLVAYKEKPDLPFPERFVLSVDLTSKLDGTSSRININVVRPPFGDENCDVINWTDDLGTGPNAWSTEEANFFKRITCMNANYEIFPEAYQFVTTQEDMDNLPEQLSQPKQNYRIIFKDEFSNPGGLEKLDHRLWLPQGNDCGSFRIADGKITLRVGKDCLSAGGGLIKARLTPKLEYKYGYLEARFSRLFYGSPIDAGRIGWHSYGVRGGNWTWGAQPPGAMSNKGFFNFLCRGVDAARKRMDWLHIFGVEKQYIEMFSNLGNFSSAWLVFHSMQVEKARRCHNVVGEVAIYSGIWWKTLSFIPGDTYTLGVEWTPSGYRFFLNGEVYDGNNSDGLYEEYGYGAGIFTNVYGYLSVQIPESNLIPGTVSHGPQPIRIEVSPAPYSRPNSLPDGWEATMELDYIRVYQPEDKYEGHAKVFE